MEPTESSFQGHSLDITANNETGVATTGADIQLEIDGKPFTASGIELKLDTSNKIIEAVVRFPVSWLNVDVNALSTVNGQKSFSIENINVQTTEPQSVNLLTGLDIKADITPSNTLFNSITLKAEAGQPVTALINSTKTEQDSETALEQLG